MTKLGRHEGYEGGMVFRTSTDAAQYLREHPVLYFGTPRSAADFSIYGLILPTGWDEDVSKGVDPEGFYRLLHDAQVVWIPSHSPFQMYP